MEDGREGASVFGGPVAEGAEEEEFEGDGFGDVDFEEAGGFFEIGDGAGEAEGLVVFGSVGDGGGGSGGDGRWRGGRSEGEVAGGLLEFDEEAGAEAFVEADLEGFDFLFAEAVGQAGFGVFPGGFGEAVEDGFEAGAEAVGGEDKVGGGGFIASVGTTGGEAAEPGGVVGAPSVPVGVGEGRGGSGKAQVKAAAADGGEKVVGAGGEEENGGVGRGFFEGFEEGVGGGDHHAVGFVDDSDFAGAGGGAEADFADEFAEGVNADEAGLAAGAEGEEVGMAGGVFGVEEAAGEVEAGDFERGGVAALHEDGVGEAALGERAGEGPEGAGGGVNRGGV